MEELWRQTNEKNGYQVMYFDSLIYKLRTDLFGIFFEKMTIFDIQYFAILTVRPSWQDPEKWEDSISR